MSRIAKNYIYNTSYQLFILLVPIIIAPYLARILGAEKLGIYGYIYSFTSIMSTIGLLGIYTYGNRETAYCRDKKEVLSSNFWEIMLIRGFLCIVTSIIFFTISTKSVYGNYFNLFYFWLLADFIDITWLFVGMENMKPAVAKNFFAKIITVVGIFVLVKSKEDLWLYLTLISISTLVANLSVYPLLLKVIDKPKFISVDKEKIKKHIGGACLLFLPQVATIMYLQVDKVMIEMLTGQTSQIAFYLYAEKIINIPLALIIGLNTVMMPRIANEFRKGNMGSMRLYLNKAVNFSLFLAFPMFIGLVNIAHKFIPWYLGSEFLPTIKALIMLSPLIVINALSGVAGQQYFVATNQINIILRAYVPAAIINFGINLVLIPKFGFLGAATASLIASFISLLILYHHMTKQIIFESLWKSGLKYFSYSLIMGGALFLLGLKLPDSATTTIIQIFAGIFIYCIILILRKDKMFGDVVAKLIKLRN